jgi:hypothetical protein
MVVYRGQDLDLRAPSEWPTAEQRDYPGPMPPLGGLTAGVPSKPRQIWVDETVLACCNHAYDLAVAHRAGEVRLEHLLNAMTRVDAAALVLEGRGVRVAALRRDSAGVIASEIPAGFAAGRVHPRTSEALEDVLRLAEERAAIRRSPATIDDILTVLSDMKRDLPGISQLRNHSQNWNLRETTEPRPYQPEQPRYAPADEPREWVRVPAGSAPYYGPEAPRPSQPMPPSAADGVQNSRLDALERAVRELTQSVRDDASRFRSGLNDRLHSLEQAVMSVRGEHAGWGGVAGDRLVSIERNVDAKFSELARTWALLGERLQALEMAVGAHPEVVMPQVAEAAERRMADIERALHSIAERIGAMERAVVARPAAADLGPLVDRLTALERLLASRPATPINVTAIGDRLATIERMLATRPATGADLTPFNERLATLTEKVQSLEGWAAEAAHGTTEASERLRALEDVSASMRATLAERVQAIAAGFERQQAQVIAAVAAPLSDRIGMLDRALATYAQQTGEATAAHQRDLKEVHEALVKLNTNQQTLAGSMDQWRLDVINDIGEVANQVKSLERASQRPVQMLESVTASLQSLERAKALREEHRSRFRYWLLGTDDWYGASYGGNGSRPPSRPSLDR